MSKAKALVDKRTNEWGVLVEGWVGTCEIPQLLAETASKERLQRYYPYLELDEFEMVDVEVTIKDNYELKDSE